MNFILWVCNLLHFGYSKCLLEQFFQRLRIVRLGIDKDFVLQLEIQILAFQHGLARR